MTLLHRIEHGGFAVAFVVCAASCTGAEHAEQPSTSSSTSGTTSVSAAGSTGAGGSGECARLCSESEPSQIIDCNGEVVEECAADGVCVAGSCSDPCATEQVSNVGCDFLVPFPVPDELSRGSCFAVVAFNQSQWPAKLSASFGGTELSTDEFAWRLDPAPLSDALSPLTDGTLPPGASAVLFLAHNPAGSGNGHYVECPDGVSAALVGETAATGTGIRQALRLRSSAPVSLVSVLPYEGSQSFSSASSVLFPTTAWTKTYEAVDAFAYDPILVLFGGLPFTQITAATPDTIVTIHPVSTIKAWGTEADVPAGQPFSLTLQDGEVFQIAQQDRLAGSRIEATHAVGVWGGSSGSNIPLGQVTADATHQQIPPREALGTAYVVVGPRERQAGIPDPLWVTVVGAADGTTLSYEPEAPQGAPASIGASEVVIFSTPIPFVVSSQGPANPFFVAVHMSGSYITGGNDLWGDPEFIVLAPVDQYKSAYPFWLDRSFLYSSVVLTRRTQAIGVECADAWWDWVPIGESGFEYARSDMISDGVVLNGCGLSRVAQGYAPFGMTIWGWDHSASYGYSAGQYLGPLHGTPSP